MGGEDEHDQDEGVDEGVLLLTGGRERLVVCTVAASGEGAGGLVVKRRHAALCEGTV